MNEASEIRVLTIDGREALEVDGRVRATRDLEPWDPSPPDTTGAPADDGPDDNWGGW